MVCELFNRSCFLCNINQGCSIPKMCHLKESHCQLRYIKVVSEYIMVFDQLKDHSKDVWRNLHHLYKEMVMSRIFGIFPSQMDRTIFWYRCSRIYIACIPNFLVDLDVILKLHACMCNIKCTGRSHAIPECEMFQVAF